MPTGQAIVNNALTTLGILEQGGVPSSSDSADGINELNSMWAAWGVDEGFIYATSHIRFPLTGPSGGQTPAWYTLGQPQPGGPQPNFNVQRPARIYGGSFLTASGGAITAYAIGDAGAGYAVGDTGIILGAGGQLATYTVTAINAAGGVTGIGLSGGLGYLLGNGYGTRIGGAQPGAGAGLTINVTQVSAEGQTRVDLRVIDAATYYAHRDLSAIALTPDELYPSFEVDPDGFMRIYIWPLPQVPSASMIELECAVTFGQWSLGVNYNIPQAVQDAINYALAFRLIPRYGVAVNPEVATVVAALAEKSEARLREMNAFNRKLPPGAERAPMPPMPVPAAGGAPPR